MFSVRLPRMKIAEGCRMDTAGGAEFDPATLFGASDHGCIIDLTDSSLLFQASAGTTAVTAAGDPIGYATDAGPDAKPGLQATAANRPLWSGTPRTLGSELIANGRFSTGSDWTLGAGCSIAAGVLTKVAGSASVASVPITVTAGKLYFVTFLITRFAGAMNAQFTGGTTVAGVSRNYRGSYVELFTAVTGNVTFELNFDATFAGTVDNVSVKEVTAYVNRGGRFDGVNDALVTASNNLSGSNKGTLVVAFQSGQSALSAVVAEHGNYNGSVTGSFHIIQNSGWAVRLRGDTAFAIITNTVTEEKLRTANPQYNVITASVDIAGATIGDEMAIRLRGQLATETTSGTTAGGGNLANGALSIGKSFNSTLFHLGLIHRAILINRTLTTDEIVQAETWARRGMVFCAVLGDSTVGWLESSVGQPQAMRISSLVGGMICGACDLARSGDTIADQLSDWTALAGKDTIERVFVQIGLNDVRGRVGFNTATSAQVIAEYQSLIDTIRADVSADCKIYACALTPCKAWLDTATNPSAAYGAWQDLNTAIAGGGATPITNIDAYINSYVAALSDGSDNLHSDYAMDTVHESNEARFIIGQAWRTQLEADGLSGAS